jgi:hypothetical protein
MAHHAVAAVGLLHPIGDRLAPGLNPAPKRRCRRGRRDNCRRENNRSQNRFRR